MGLPKDYVKLLKKLTGEDVDIGGNHKLEDFKEEEQEILSNFSLLGYVKAFKPDGTINTPHNNSGEGKFYYRQWKDKIEDVKSVELTPEGVKESNKYYNFMGLYPDKNILWMIISVLMPLIIFVLTYIFLDSNSNNIVEIIFSP